MQSSQRTRILRPTRDGRNVTGNEFQTQHSSQREEPQQAVSARVESFLTILLHAFSMSGA